MRTEEKGRELWYSLAEGTHDNSPGSPQRAKGMGERPRNNGEGHCLNKPEGQEQGMIQL